MRACDKSILKTLKLADEMLLLAHEGESVQEDTGCGILYGVLKDSAFRIKGLAEKEKESHIRKGWWNTSEGGE